MGSVEGCFSYGQGHLAKDDRSRDVTTVVITKLKSTHPAAFLTAENVFARYSMMEVHDEKKLAAHQIWCKHPKKLILLR